MSYTDSSGRNNRNRYDEHSRNNSQRTSSRTAQTSRPYAHNGSRGREEDVYRSSRTSSSRSSSNGSRRSSSSGRGRSSGRRRNQKGYEVKRHQINFQGNRRNPNSTRWLLLLAATVLVLVIVIVVVVNVSSEDEEEGTGNELDSRVAAGVSDELTLELADALDQAEIIEQIALNADQYSDEAIVELALNEPTAIELVYDLLDEDWTAQSYDDEVSQGTAPELYCWDARWGGVTYADNYLALTGSGPTALAMAYMGLTGTSGQTPATIAALISAAELDTGDSGMSADYLTSNLSSIGLECSTYVSSGDNLTAVLDSGTYILIEAEAGSLTDETHWVLLVTENSDDTIVVYDPTSTSVSASSWSADTLADSCETLYAITEAEVTEEETTETSE